jgi:S1-C subfamily serine protease
VWPLENKTKPKHNFPITIIAVVLVASLIAGSLIGYGISTTNASANISNLNDQVTNLQKQLNNLQSDQTTVVADNVGQTVQTSTYTTYENVSLSQLYTSVENSVVVVECETPATTIFGMSPYAGYSQVQGSGFVYNYNGQMVIITNNHVVNNAVNITVTFINGNTYPATVLGSDGYADLAVLSADAPQNEYYPLEITSSSTLSVGDPLVAIGGPYGLAGTMTTGIVSALNRTITEDMSGSYPIAAVIQTSTPINSGNSGGPLMTYSGQVVGITTAIVSNSNGLGFAIPSDTILREIGSLITTGTYNKHPIIGAAGTDMTYSIAQAMNTNVTYGWLITQVTAGGPADHAGLKAGTKQTNIDGTTTIIGGDIIVAINGYRTRNIDDLSTYLEQNTTPGQTMTITIIRNNQTQNLSLTLGTRPTQT